MINTTIGKYKITKLIGEGGMASVYEAEHKMLGTKVAIKVLNPILSSNTQIRERFKNEARLMASLNHPNITKVLDFEEGNSQLSIVMELLEGENLNERIKRTGSLTEKEITEIFSQVLSSFQYAHEKNIVHRDIKPSNIFILSNGQVKILDFGVAKLVGEGSELTQTGTQLGTPVYMSPEQVKAEKDIDHRSDIYSLGVTLYFAVKGNPPYNSITDSQFNIFNRIVFEPIPNLKVGDKYDQMILKACYKERNERYQSCKEWHDELKRNNKSKPTVSKVRSINNETKKDETIIETVNISDIEIEKSKAVINKQVTKKNVSEKKDVLLTTNNKNVKTNNPNTQTKNIESNSPKSRKSKIWIFYLLIAVVIAIVFAKKLKEVNAYNTNSSEYANNVVNEKYTLINGNIADYYLKYLVNVGNFKSLIHAEGLNETLRKDDYSSFIIIGENGLYRVIIGAYTNYQDAESMKEDLSNRFPDAKIYVYSENKD